MIHCDSEDVYSDMTTLYVIIYCQFCWCSGANVDMFSQDVCTLASVDSNNRTGLMDAARQLAGAFTDLLNVARPGSDEVLLTTAYLLNVLILELSLQLK